MLLFPPKLSKHASSKRLSSSSNINQDVQEHCPTGFKVYKKKVEDDKQTWRAARKEMKRPEEKSKAANGVMESAKWQKGTPTSLNRQWGTPAKCFPAYPVNEAIAGSCGAEPVKARKLKLPRLQQQRDVYKTFSQEILKVLRRMLNFEW